jgi:hypothetical protein
VTEMAHHSAARMNANRTRSMPNVQNKHTEHDVRAILGDRTESPPQTSVIICLEPPFIHYYEDNASGHCLVLQSPVLYCPQRLRIGEMAAATSMFIHRESENTRIVTTLRPRIRRRDYSYALTGPGVEDALK